MRNVTGKAHFDWLNFVTLGFLFICWQNQLFHGFWLDLDLECCCAGGTPKVRCSYVQPIDKKVCFVSIPTKKKWCFLCCERDKRWRLMCTRPVGKNPMNGHKT